MRLTKKQKRASKRRVDIEKGIEPPKHSIYKNKKKYNRKKKHIKDEQRFSKQNNRK